VTRRDAALPVASSSTSSSTSLPPRAAYGSDTQYGGRRGPDQISSYNSPQPGKQSHRERTAHRPRAGQLHRTPSARSPLKSPSPALRRQSFSMSSFSSPPVAPVPTKTSERTRTPRGNTSSDLQVVTGGGVLSREENNGNTTVTLNYVSPLLDHTPEPASEHNPSSKALPVVRDNSRLTRNEESDNDPKGSIEKTNTVGQRRNESLDEGNRSRQGASGYDAYWMQHRQTRSVSRRDCTPIPHTALILSNQTSVDENNLTIPVMEMIPAHHMFTTPMKVEKNPTNISRRCPKPSRHQLVPQLVADAHPILRLLHPHLYPTGIIGHFRAAIWRRRAGPLDRVVRIQICSLPVISLATILRCIPIINRGCRDSLPLTRPRAPQLGINPQTRNRPPPRNGADGPVALVASAIAISLTLGMPIRNQLQNCFLLLIITRLVTRGSTFLSLLWAVPVVVREAIL
jgi:hypothetical protein